MCICCLLMPPDAERRSLTLQGEMQPSFVAQAPHARPVVTYLWRRNGRRDAANLQHLATYLLFLFNVTLRLETFQVSEAATGLVWWSGCGASCGTLTHDDGALQADSAAVHMAAMRQTDVVIAFHGQGA